MTRQLLLFESASGFSLFEALEFDTIAQLQERVQSTVKEFGKFNKLVKLISFIPFTTAEHALENVSRISEGELTEFLRDFLEVNIPKAKNISLGVAEEKIASAINEALELQCVIASQEYRPEILDLFRGIRRHFHKFIEKLTEDELHKAQLGLAHSYSRSKVKFNINRVDNMIIQSIAVLDQLDKDINVFAMRVKEWYSWHFPELAAIVPDNYNYARLVNLIKHKNNLSEELIPEIEEISEGKGQQIIDAARSSMGTDISILDMRNIEHFASRVANLSKYRQNLFAYVQKKMNDVAPNLSALLGELVGARLISHAGSLINLAKFPSSTVQILGAEKALFRALKTRGNTPKYGLLFNSSYISRASVRDKGRISRYLASKCSLASRFDAFSELAGNTVGEKLRQQVEDRLLFYDKGIATRKNIDVMHDAIVQIRQLNNVTNDKMEVEEPSGKKQKKKEKPQIDSDEDRSAKKKQLNSPASEEKNKKKKRKQKKNKDPKDDASDKESQSDEEDKKKKKKKKKDSDNESDEDKKKKKKKKKASVDDASDKESRSDEEDKKKKKKKKKKASVDDASDKESQSDEEDKKKKKKKKDKKRKKGDSESEDSEKEKKKKRKTKSPKKDSPKKH